MNSRLEHVVARNAVQLRRNRGWTQLDLARRMSEVGMAWTPGRAQQVESYAGTLSLPEVLGLCWALEVPIADLLTGDEQITLAASGRSIELRHFRDALRGRGAIREADHSAEDAADFEEVRAKATQLDLGSEVFVDLCQQRFGRTFRAERDARAGDLTKLPPRSAQVKRGHAGRAVLADIRDHLNSLGGAAQASLLAYRATAGQIEAELEILEQRTTQGRDAATPDPQEARELVTESTRIYAAVDRLGAARYIHTDTTLLDQVDQLRMRIGHAQLNITTTFGLHLSTHLADGSPL